MKHLKYFESEKQFRIVDIQKMYDDFQHFKTEFKGFLEDVLSPLFLNKDIEFDDLSGEVSSIGHKITKDNVLIIGTLYGHGHDNILTFATLDLFADNKINSPKTVKIYNCEIINFENKVDELKMKEDAGKYNI